MPLTITLSLIAAVCFGTASVLQHYGANRVRRRSPLHPGLLADVVRQPWWLLGITIEVVAVGLHMLAVNVGPLSVVQPLLTVGLVIALLLQMLLGQPIPRRSLLGAVLTVGGLAVFLALRPATEPARSLPPAAWWPGLLVAALAAVMLAFALVRRGRQRALGLGAAAGICFALSAAVVKTWGPLLEAGGVGALAVSWQCWTALGCGLVGALVSQAAFQAGALGPPLAAMMVVDPLVGVSLGVAVYGEAFSTGALAVLQISGLTLTLVGIGLLASVSDPSHAARDDDASNHLVP